MVPIVCFLVFQGAYAIDISFSASNGGGSVGMTDSYDVDDSVGVSSQSSASFGGGVSMTDSKSISGSGDANVDQVFYGSGLGADYIAEYALRTFDASSIEAGGSASLKPNSCHASKSASTIGSSRTYSKLYGAQGGDLAFVDSFAFGADVSTSQSIAAGQSIVVSQKTQIEGDFGWAGSTAEDDKGSYVDIFAEVEFGSLDTEQWVEATNSAGGYQETEIEALWFAGAYCEAYNPGEDYYAYVDNYIISDASLYFKGESSVNDDEARAHQVSYAEGGFIWPWANSTSVDRQEVKTGTYNSESRAWTNSSGGDDAVIVEL